MYNIGIIYNIYIALYTQPISVGIKNKGVCVIGINDAICLLRSRIIVYIYKLRVPPSAVVAPLRVRNGIRSDPRNVFDGRISRT